MVFMHTKRWFSGWIFSCLFLAGSLFGSEELSDQEAMNLGRQVWTVKQALENPQAPESLDAVISLGQDSRYYVMVRGWLLQHIQMAESYRGTSDYQNSPDQRLQVEKNISVLQKMLRRIDLE